MIIRRLTAGDETIAAAIARLYKAADVPPEDFARFLARADCILIAALDRQEPVGFVLAYELPRIDGPRPMIHLYEIEVSEQYRRQGIARKMIAQLKSIARQRSACKAFVITIAANEPAMGLYASTGGRRTHPDDVVFNYDEQALTGP
jgi:ribosomal protein S18 acetylase RimI-like enzyme